MSLAQRKGISGFLTSGEKKELIHKAADAILSVEGEGLREVTWVMIADVTEG